MDRANHLAIWTGRLPLADGPAAVPALLVVGDRAAPFELLRQASAVTGLESGALGAALGAAASADAHGWLPETGSVAWVICWQVGQAVGENGRLLADLRRSLQPGGKLLLVDLLLPGSRLRGKKAGLQRQAGAYVAGALRFRDPAYAGGLSLPDWEDRCLAAGLQIRQQASCDLEVDLAVWTAVTGLPAADQIRLRALLRQAPEPARACLTCHLANDRIFLRLKQTLLLMEAVSSS